MAAFVDFEKIGLETNSALWRAGEREGEPVLQVVGNTAEDHVGGKVALLGRPRRNYTMRVEMRFLGHHLEQPAGWFGFVMRAQDTLNYEIVWFMPMAEKNTAAYVPVAHGVVPWWTEAYATQQKGAPPIPTDAWFGARVDVVGDAFTLFVGGEEVFRKKLTYYLEEGRPGLYVGTATDAAFRRVVIEDLA